jgi:hypothetical protein
MLCAAAGQKTPAASKGYDSGDFAADLRISALTPQSDGRTVRQAGYGPSIQEEDRAGLGRDHRLQVVACNLVRLGSLLWPTETQASSGWREAISRALPPGKHPSPLERQRGSPGEPSERGSMLTIRSRSADKRCGARVAGCFSKFLEGEPMPASEKQPLSWRVMDQVW